MGAVWATRLRWRLKGASQWPAFVAFTTLEGVLLNELPVSGRGPGGIVPGLLIAGFVNLFVVAVPAPLAGRMLRRRRPALPRPVAADFAGTALLACVAVFFLAAGFMHRPAVLAEREARGVGILAVSDYVESQAPEYAAGIHLADTLRLSDDLYRTCVPGEDARRPLCLFVATDQRPAGVTRDPDLAPNSAYRVHGAFR